MNRDELQANMAANARRLADLASRTDVNGRISPQPTTEADRQRTALEGGLALALANGDAVAAEIFAGSIAKLTATADGAPLPDLGDADQGRRGPPPGTPSPLTAEQRAESEGDWRTAMRLKSERLAQLRSREG